VGIPASLVFSEPGGIYFFGPKNLRGPTPGRRTLVLRGPLLQWLLLFDDSGGAAWFRGRRRAMPAMPKQSETKNRISKQCTSAWRKSCPRKRWR